MARLKSAFVWSLIAIMLTSSVFAQVPIVPNPALHRYRVNLPAPGAIVANQVVDVVVDVDGYGHCVCAYGCWWEVGADGFLYQVGPMTQTNAYGQVVRTQFGFGFAAPVYYGGAMTRSVNLGYPGTPGYQRTVFVYKDAATANTPEAKATREKAKAEDAAAEPKAPAPAATPTGTAAPAPAATPTATPTGTAPAPAAPAPAAPAPAGVFPAPTAPAAPAAPAPANPVNPGNAFGTSA